MPDDKKQATNWKWIPPRDGVFRDLYANIIHPSWSLFDVRFRLGQLVPAADYESDFVIEEKGTVIMSWHQAKVVRDALNDLIASYEKVNGELAPLKLTPAPPSFSGDKG
jgi:hypothetical protein